LIAFVTACSDQDWRAAPLAADGDPRPVAVIVDHVADSYEYLAGWIRQIVAGEAGLNAEHAAAAAAATQTDSAEHLRRSGAAISGLIAGLSADDLAAGDGRVAAFAQVAIRHADNHRTDIQAALRPGEPGEPGEPAATPGSR
jgi:hypothetical protein